MTFGLLVNEWKPLLIYNLTGTLYADDLHLAEIIILNNTFILNYLY
jgi:hypothetical protein